MEGQWADSRSSVESGKCDPSAPLPNLEDLQISETKGMAIDDFDLLKIIGQGAYGKVMLVKKKDTSKVYAIKMLKKRHIIKKNQVAHTIAEREILVSRAAHLLIARRRKSSTLS